MMPIVYPLSLPLSFSPSLSLSLSSLSLPLSLPPSFSPSLSLSLSSLSLPLSLPPSFSPSLSLSLSSLSLPLSLSLFPPLSLNRLRTDGSNLIQDRKYHLQTFKQSFIGREFVDWLITRGEVGTREEGTQLGRQFVDAGVFRHGKERREREREREDICACMYIIITKE